MEFSNNFYRAFSTVYLIQLSRFWERDQGKSMVKRYKKVILHEMNKANCVSLTSLDDSDMEIAKMWQLLCRSNIIDQEFRTVIENIIKSNNKVGLIRDNNGPKAIKQNSDLFLREISSIFHVSLIIYHKSYNPYRVIRSNQRDCVIGILLNVDDSNQFIPRITNNEVNLPDSIYLKEPYCFITAENAAEPTEELENNELMRLLALSLKEFKLHLTKDQKDEIAEAIMLDTRFIELRNELLTTITCEHTSCLSIFNCKKLHCYMCLKDEMLLNQNQLPLKCSCGILYADEDKKKAAALN